MRHRSIAIIFVVLMGACASFEPRAATPLFSTHEAGKVRPCGTSGSDALTPCRLRITQSAAALARIAATSSPAIAGDTLTLAVRAASATTVTMVGGLRLSLENIEGTDIWAAMVHVPRMNESVISYRIMTDTTKDVPRRRDIRGARAAARPARSASLHGRLRVDTLRSSALGMPREIISYVPRTTYAGRTNVVYVADGATVRDLAPMVDTLIATGVIPPVILVGVKAARAIPGDENSTLDRAREYVYGFSDDSTRFLAHEKFFIEEVGSWAEATLNASNVRAGRAIWGASNGGAFAVAMGLRHPDRFAHVIAASPVYARIPEPARRNNLPTFTLSAGTFEEVVRATTSTLAETLREERASAEFTVFPGGHDDLIWSEEFVRSIEHSPTIATD